MASSIKRWEHNEEPRDNGPQGNEPLKVLPRPQAHSHTTRLVEGFRAKPRWWQEIAYCAAFYAVYTFIRNVHGTTVSTKEAMHHATQVVGLERRLGLFHEVGIQQAFLSHTAIVRGLDVFYGTAHFVITVSMLLWLFHLHTERYQHWRNILFATTALALVGYMAFPLAPPRLLPASYGFTDTLNTIGGLWSFDSNTVQKVSNQYAAMPSLHVAWALWCAFAVIPTLKRRWAQALAALYPVFTVTAVIVTANHYWLDIFGGGLIFSIGYVAAAALEARQRRAVNSVTVVDLVERVDLVESETANGGPARIPSSMAAKLN